MADFYFPIVSKESVARTATFLGSSPSPEPNIALVLVSKSRSVILQCGETLTAGEWRWGGFHTVYQVDTATFPVNFQCDLPCKSDAFHFQANVQLDCSANDPATIVQRNSSDIKADIEKRVIDAIRPLSRTYDVEEIEKAEDALRREIKRLDYQIGVEIDYAAISLDLEEGTREYIRKQREIRWNTVIDKAEIEHVRKVESTQAILERERRDREMEKVKFCEDLVGQRDAEALTFYLMTNRDDAPMIIEMMNRQHQIKQEHQLRMLTTLLSKSDIKGWEVTQLLQNILMPGEDLPRLGPVDKKNEPSTSNESPDDESPDDPNEAEEVDW